MLTLWTGRLARLGALALLGLALTACHKAEPDASTAPADATTGASAAEAVASTGSPSEREVWATMHRKYPRMTISQVSETTTPGEPVYQVTASAHRFVTNRNVDFLVDGGMLIVGVGDNVRNVTQNDAEAAGARLYGTLPLKFAVTQVFGKGERQMVMFADPDCEICQGFEKELAAQGASLNATVYIFPLPLVGLHPDAANKAAYLLCTANPGQAWGDWMAHAEDGWAAWSAKNPSQAQCPTANNVLLGARLAQNLGFNKTPTLMFPNGVVVPGAPSLPQLEAIWAKPAPGAAPSP
jgi:thiol:disulfide interchange protein DsbC